MSLLRATFAVVFRSCAPALGLALLLACGGGSQSPAPATATVPATGLTYTDPAGSGWRLVKDAGSTSTRLVLNLVGPTGFLSRGAGFNLQLPVGVKAGVFPGTVKPIRDLGVYQLLNMTHPYVGGPLEPTIVMGGVKPGNLLTVAEFQKDRQVPAKDSGAPLFQIALEFDATAKLSSGEALPLPVVKAKYMADDIGIYNPYPTPEMTAKARLVDMSVAVGTLVAK